jgi:SsrA-binding protein
MMIPPTSDDSAGGSSAGAAVRTRRIENRRARHDYHVLETWEAGLALLGSEVKSLRLGRAQLAGAFAILRPGRVLLLGCHIEEYVQANQLNHDPTRSRALLLHRREIRRIAQALAKQPGATLIPLAIYFKRGYAKVELALAIGKAKFDKRQALQQREAARQMQRALRRR